jgi:UDP-glucose 4-epimerase
MLTCQDCWINVGKKQTHIFSFSTETPVVKELDVFVTGGTGYMGSRLISILLVRGHRVRVLARQTSLGRVPDGATPVVGDALDAESVAAALRSGDAGDAKRLGLVTIEQMLGALVAAVENPPPNGRVQIVNVAGIRSAGR